MVVLLRLVSALAVLALLAVRSDAALIGPSPYLSFADSPFGGGTFSYFHLETFEDGSLSTPGVTASAGFPLAPAYYTDSVDGDDGTIDGSGVNGWSFFSELGSVGIAFTFDELLLGGLPTAAGIVWTDGFTDIRFEAFDQNGVSLGVLIDTHADSTFLGTTAEDRFYGVTNPGGISRITIADPGDSSGIEVDHLQYGREASDTPVPEPSTLSLLALGGLSLVRYRRRSRKPSRGLQ